MNEKVTTQDFAGTAGRLPSGGLAYSVLRKLPLAMHTVLIGDNDEAAADMEEDVKTLSFSFGQQPPSTLFLPETDTAARIQALRSLTDSSGRKFLIFASESGWNKKTFSPESFKASTIRLTAGSAASPDIFAANLAGNGYERVDTVTDIGEFSVRGEIIDVWPALAPRPVRIVLYVNTVETIKSFDPISQRSIERLGLAEIFPLTEKEETGISAHLKGGFRLFDAADIIPTIPAPEFSGDIELLRKKYDEWHADDFCIFITANNDAEREHLLEILGNAYSKAVFTGVLSSGFVCKSDSVVFVTTNEIFSRYKLKIRQPKFKIGKAIESLEEISAGDYVVHERHGIGIYEGLKKLKAGGITAEYISIIYSNDDVLYVPVNDFSLIQKYFSVGQREPKINSLDSVAWARTKEAATENAVKMAAGLIGLYAERLHCERPAFIFNPHYEAEFEKEFLYEETQDQKKAIDDIYSDMAGRHPMDRCVFGDVGFGKTEVAMRAAFRVIMSGRQVCLMAPTTVLAQQHERTFSDRFADWPVKIESLTRFKSKKEQKDILGRLKDGKVDVIIGTHRLLGDDIAFANLGLLMIDEEHRFGVAAKEKLKMLKKNVDCLYLTATPIPRTLSLAMAGIKDVSYIETPPAGRQQISTMLAEYDDKTVYDAIMHEISRGGQVFYIYNKVETIETRVERLRKMMPAAKFDFLHGQMPAATIEKKMLSFLRDEFDCLVSTTIIEAGLDIPNVNTIIIDEAEDLGLGQLYQLRGRVGRSKIKAYSYLLYRKENLTENGRKRLAAINEFTKLGSGFQLALKDLQIRGAGELLGKRQHGYIDSVGLDMYTRLLEQYAADFKGIERETEQATEISIPVDAVIPDDYINNETTRIEFYRKLAAASDTAEIESEMKDRFGPLPRETVNLIGVNRARHAAQKLGIEKIESGPDGVTIKFSPDTGIEPARVLEALKGRNFRFVRGDELKITFDYPLEQEKNLAWIELILKSIK